MFVICVILLSIANILSGSPIENEPLQQNCKGPNEIRVKCGVFCPATCSGIEKAQQCLAVCVPNVCECLPGYLRDDRTRKCVLPCECPKIEENE